jgi:hypothetical protein
MPRLSYIRTLSEPFFAGFDGVSSTERAPQILEPPPITTVYGLRQLKMMQVSEAVHGIK